MDVRWLWCFLDRPAPAEAAWRFWCEVTRSRLSARRGERAEFATLLPQAGDPWIKLQETAGTCRTHLDLDVDDIPTAIAQAEALGAQVIHRTTQGYAVLASPGGFTFCLTTWDGSASRPRLGPTLLDQVCLDIPPRAYAAEVAFWQSLLTAQVLPGRIPGFALLAPARELPLRILLQRLDADAPAVNAHADLACANRSQAVAEHEALGATVVAEFPHWSVLADPAGARYCLTDRDPLTGRLA